MDFTFSLFLVSLSSKGLILILFCICGTLERTDLMEPIQGRLRNLMVTVEDQDTHELLEDTIALIEHNQCRQRIWLGLGRAASS